MKKTIIEPYYQECLDLETAGELMNARVAKIMQAIYAEEAKDTPSAEILKALDRSHGAVEEDRYSMRGNKPEIVLQMIEKYSRIQKNEPHVFEDVA